MLIFEWILGILLGAVLLSALARRIGVPYPALLALGGTVVAFMPGAPRIILDPELALALFVAPVLLDAAYDTSPRDLKDNWVPVTSLVLVAVGLTTAAVAIVAKALTGMPWAAAIALGAIVAPPDAAAATAVLRQLNLPHRLVTVLEGESLLNDASALLIYRVAVTAATVGGITVASAAPLLLASVAGSLILGPILALTYMRLMTAMDWSDDRPSSIILQFISTFGVWLLADRLGLSGILTIVAYAITIARRAPATTSAHLRVPSYAVWDTVVFVLNVLAFALIGLQIGPIFETLGPEQRLNYLLIAAAVLATVILVRIAWVMSYNWVVRRHIRRHGFHPPRPMAAPTIKSGLLVSWCGMRGIVTLAAAFALPNGADGLAFPHRNLIVFVAFCVVLGTLVIQGFTLRPLLSKLNLSDDDPVGQEVARARTAAYRAALAAIDGDSSPLAEAMRVELQLGLLQGDGNGGEPVDGAPADNLRLRTVLAARQAVLAMRNSGDIGDSAFHRLEEEIDRLELSVS
ncbi:MAG TPA: sodium:proton antiporter [Hyphomicrobiaceae bacterium]|nr:sodium:proton antiporter [Hyphomicrobiaceae bacterium]